MNGKKYPHQPKEKTSSDHGSTIANLPSRLERGGELRSISISITISPRICMFLPFLVDESFEVGRGPIRNGFAPFRSHAERVGKATHHASFHPRGPRFRLHVQRGPEIAVGVHEVAAAGEWAR